MDIISISCYIGCVTVNCSSCSIVCLHLVIISITDNYLPEMKFVNVLWQHQYLSLQYFCTIEWGILSKILKYLILSTSDKPYSLVVPITFDSVSLLTSLLFPNAATSWISVKNPHTTCPSPYGGEIKLATNFLKKAIFSGGGGNKTRVPEKENIGLTFPTMHETRLQMNTIEELAG